MENGIKVKKTGNKVELSASHGKGELTFLVPHLCWMNQGKTFVETKESLRRQRLSFPTLAETASIVYAAWQNPKNEYSQRVIKTIEDKPIWTNTGILSVPSKGIYVQDSPKVIWWKHFNKSELIKRLEAGDKNVRFAPFEEESFNLNAEDLAKSKLLIALAGEEGAEKLAYVASKYGSNQHSLPYSEAKYERDKRRIDSQVVNLCVRAGLWISGEDVKFFPNYNNSFAIVRRNK